VTALVWEGKYRDGKRVAPVRIALPFQTVETANESARDRARTLDLFASGKPTDELAHRDLLLTNVFVR
jgi:adenine-specific DNA-methyltransferase